VKNNHRVRDCIESYESGQFGQGVQDITGSMEVYFENADVYQAMLDNSEIAMTFHVIDSQSTGYDYTFDLPKMKIAGTTQDIGGNDTDIIQAVDWRAMFDQGLGYQMKITRTPIP
jgi:hypothetical protein